VSDDGINSVAILAGNPTMAVGAAVVDLYHPMRDRTVTVGAPLAGHRVFEIELSAGLPDNLLDREALDCRVGLLAVGGIAFGAGTVRLACDYVPLPGDRLYFDTLNFTNVTMAVDTGLLHHTTGYKVYDVLMDATAPSAVVDNEPVYTIASDPCWLNGDPVTPLAIMSFEPSGYLVP
jgi:hypothetical protein